MILMGDEVRRTQSGNNNAYCQDNETSWFDWTLLEKHADLHRFVTLLIARRLLRDTEHERQRISLNQLIRQAEQDMAWREARGQPDWSHDSHSLAFEADATAGTGSRMYLILNAYWEPLDFELPPAGDGGQALAPMDRYLARVPGGHCPVADGAFARLSDLSGRGALRRGAHPEEREP